MSRPAFKSRWLAWAPEKVDGTRTDRTDKTDKTDAAGASVGFVSRVQTRETAKSPAVAGHGELTAGTIDAVLIRSAGLDGALLWLVADAEAVAEHPDILRSGLPVFFFDEVEQLRGKTPAELKAIAMVKATFPTSRVLQ
ncbi:MAG: hypothetical protein ACHQ4J_05050 [Candidatus Binatia bacterium]